MKKTLSAILIALLSLCSMLQAAEPSAAVLLAGSNRYKSVRLTPDAYRHAAPNLANLRLRDAAGNDVPYFVLSGRTYNETKENVYAANQVAAFIEKEYYHQDFAIADKQEHVDLQINQLRFTSAQTNFGREVELLGSFDGLVWQPICSAMLYRVEGYQKLDIPLPSVKKYSHYRLRYYNPSGVAPLSFNEVIALYNSATISEESFSAITSLAFSIESKNKQTIVSIANPDSLQLSGLRLSSEDLFSRRYALGAQQGELVRLSFDNGVQINETGIDLPTLQRDRELKLTIYDNDNQPISIQRIEAIYALDELIFTPPAEGGCSLVFLAVDTPAQVYDINKYREYILQQEIDECSLEAINQLALPEPPPAADYGWLLNAAVFGAAVLLGGIILAKLKAG